MASRVNCNIKISPKYLTVLVARPTYPTTAKGGGDKFPIFTILVGFLHSSGVVGQNARDALLLCMSMSKKHHKIGKHIATNTNFCPVIFSKSFADS